MYIFCPVFRGFTATLGQNFYQIKVKYVNFHQLSRILTHAVPIGMAHPDDLVILPTLAKFVQYVPACLPPHSVPNIAFPLLPPSWCAKKSLPPCTCQFLVTPLLNHKMSWIYVASAGFDLPVHVKIVCYSAYFQQKVTVVHVTFFVNRTMCIERSE